jgi:hypothetical protein
VSATVTVNDAVPVLLCRSVAEHVTVVVPIGKTLPEVGLHVVGRVPSNRSSALAENATAAPAGDVASAVMLAGTVTIGAVLSVTVTVNVFVVALPRLSVAVQLTVVVPSANVLPEALAQLVDTGLLTLLGSVAVTAKVTAAPAPDVASVVMLAGTTSVGAVVSRTVTLNDPVAVLRAASLTEQLTVVVPNPNGVPEAGVHVGMSTPLTESLALAA